MKLIVMTPSQIICQVDEVTSVHVEEIAEAIDIDKSYPDLITPLAPCVLAWHDAEGARGSCRLAGGVLSVSHGDRVIVTTRDAQVRGKHSIGTGHHHHGKALPAH